ncbi:MAG: bifunctional phosphopantothenoylcysteine decarboxylase/phosphopantothenate--cysteine ligase CoaBC [Bacteroidales bacterium]|nr:bifunctional phosphopantothenoylcysteine decarboxylase/phosphopantothenate--cysteine ligase CoaBC [Bacteroidales bacterium]
MRILLGVTGSIAAYKIANLASMLVKLKADVHVVMTRNACQFITPTTFETLTGHKCLVDTFDRDHEYHVQHVSLAQQVDLILIAPASANVIARLAHGICDDMLTTTVLASSAPKLVAPAMNTGMWRNPILQDNLERLRHYGFDVIQPATGRLACGDVGEGKMPSEEVLLQHILLHVGHEHDWQGRRVLISAGPTREAIDPVRYITNHSSGKMGYALARAAAMRGAEVTLVSGPVEQTPFCSVERVPVVSAADMYREMTQHSDAADVIIMCSAVADYTPVHCAEHKMHKGEGDMALPLTRTQDILQYLGDHKREGQVLVGFSMETDDLLARSRAKLARKHADLICANPLVEGQSGFGVDTNRVSLITADQVVDLPLCSKDETAQQILDYVQEHWLQA